MKLVLATLAATVFVASTASASVFGMFSAREIAEGSASALTVGYSSSRLGRNAASSRSIFENGGALRQYSFKSNTSRIVGLGTSSNR